MNIDISIYLLIYSLDKINFLKNIRDFRVINKMRVAYSTFKLHIEHTRKVRELITGQKTTACFFSFFYTFLHWL